MSAAPETHPPRRAGMREWFGLAVIAIPCLLYSMDLTVLNLASPHLSADLQSSGTELLWIVDIYGFMIAGSLITMGTLGDRIGRRKLLLIGAAAFGLASILASFSTSAAMLIAARAVLGVAAATLAPSTLSLIRNMFLDPAERTTAIAVWVASFSIGAAIGPLIGGWLLTHFWWGSVFLINVPMMLLLLALGPRLLPEFRNANAGRLDVVSAVVSVGSVLLIIYGVKHLAEAADWAAATPACAAGIVLGWIFVRRQARLEHPLMDLSLFRSFAFSATLSLTVVDFFVSFGVALFLSQYLQLALGLSPFEAGLWTVPSALGFVAGSLVAPRIAARVATGHVVAGGFLLAAIGLAVLTQIEPGHGLAMVVGGGVTLSFGLAPVVILSTDLIVGAAPPEQAGSAAALSETAAELGGALGIALLGSVVTATYRAGTAEIAAGDVPAAAAAAARETLGAAAAIARDLPPDLGAQVFDTARAAFTLGIQWSAAAAAVLAVAAAILALIALRTPAPRQTPIHKLESVHVELKTRSLPATRAFYVDRLGLRVVQESEGLLALLAGTLRISIFETGEVAAQHAMHVIFRVDDLDEAQRNLEARGVRFEGGRRHAPGFMDYLLARDPDGRPVEIAKYLRDPMKQFHTP